MTAALILVAAGRGARLGGDTPKALVPLAGRPLFAHSLATLSAIPGVTRALVVAAPERQAEVLSLVDSAGPWPIPVDVIVGGAERQDSVGAGIARVQNEDLVVIHDAARPFITAECAEQCLRAATTSGAAIVAIPANDTLKWADDARRSERTLDRSRIWLAQTPQIFRTDLLRRAIAHARSQQTLATDDAALVEALGIPVQLVSGSVDNRKITTPADLRWAEWFAAQERSL